MKRKHATADPNGWLKRKHADRHRLYEEAVQATDFEVWLMNRFFKRLRGRLPVTMREDFCGTAKLCREWIEAGPERRAIGLDLDRETLDWGIENNLKMLGSRQEHVTLLEQDVRSVTEPKTDVACAYNFSYNGFRARADLVDYFAHVRRSLNDDGLFFLDVFGGWESSQVQLEDREVDCDDGRFVFEWEQAQFNPINQDITCHIHFEFSEDVRWERAFTYRWRLYSIAELCDALVDGGFGRCHVLWDRSPDEDDSDFRLAKKAENTPGWIAYIIADVRGDEEGGS